MTKAQAQAWQRKHGMDSDAMRKLAGKPARPKERIYEDDPRFDPKTMGNRSTSRIKRRKPPPPRSRVYTTPNDGDFRRWRPI